MKMIIMDDKKIEKRIMVPDNLDVQIDDKRITIKGPRGQISKDFSDPRFSKRISIGRSGNEISIVADSNEKKIRSLCGTIAAHARNMIGGATSGYKYKMKVFYTHFPITISVKDKEVQIRNFVGEKGARTARIIGNAEVNVGKDELEIVGVSIEDVSQTAANIEQACKITKRDRRVFQDGVYLTGKYLETGERIKG